MWRLPWEVYIVDYIFDFTELSTTCQSSHADGKIVRVESLSCCFHTRMWILFIRMIFSLNLLEDCGCHAPAKHPEKKTNGIRRLFGYSSWVFCWTFEEPRRTPKSLLSFTNCEFTKKGFEVAVWIVWSDSFYWNYLLLSLKLANTPVTVEVTSELILRPVNNSL